MSLKIGVSGVRGIIGDSLTEDVISNFAKAYGTFVYAPRLLPSPLRGEGRGEGRTILIGRDTRQSGEFVRKIVIDGLLSTGCGIVDVGLCPTPTALFLTRALKLEGAIIITASHNSAQWNGLKFVRPDGTFLTKQQVEKLISIYNSKKFKLLPNVKTICPVGANNYSPLHNRFAGRTHRFAPATLHLDAVVRAVDAAAIKKAKFKVALDYCNGTGAVTSPYLLEKLGCEVIAINAEPNGRFAHNPEPTAKSLGQLCEFVKKTKADVGFAQDPDADRLVVVSEKGIAIGEENTLALAVKHVLLKDQKTKKRKNQKTKIVVNLSTSRMIDDICNEFGARLYRSAVGETNVVDMMREKRAVIGGEGNGGVIYPAVNFGRDSFIGMALILEYMTKTGKKVSELVGGIKQYQIEKTKIDCPQEKIKGILGRVRKYAFAGGRDAINRVSTIDGVKIDYPDGWVHVRGSNTEPVIRIMAEAESKEQAQEYIKNIEDVILTWS